MPVGAEGLVVVVGLLEVVGLEGELDVEVGELGAVELDAGAEEPAGVAGAKPN